MSATKGFKFDEYELVIADETDLDLVTEWTAADPAHNGVIAPASWLRQDVGIDSYLLHDKDGEVFFIQLERCTRVRIQFPPAATEEEKSRLRGAMHRGIQWLTGALGRCGVREIIFDSEDILLRRLATGFLGFKAERNTLCRSVPIVVLQGTQTPEETGEMREVQAVRVDSQSGTLEAGV